MWKKVLDVVFDVLFIFTVAVSGAIVTNRCLPFAAELQKYLGGSTKYCQHCKIQISTFTAVRKKATEVPLVVQDGVSDDLFFCSTSCYLQMLLLVPPIISEQKVSDSEVFFLLR